MKERRYKKHFRIVTDVDPRTGKARERAEYGGEYYRFPEGSPAPRRRAAAIGARAALGWAAALVYLYTARATSRCMYALVPVIAALIPGAYLLFGLFSLAASPARMTVVQRENGPGRLVRASVGFAALTAVGAAGCAVCLALSGQWAGGWSEPLLTALAAAAGWSAFAVSRRAYQALEAAPQQP